MTRQENFDDLTIGGEPAAIQADVDTKADRTGDDITPQSVDTTTVYASNFNTLNAAIDAYSDRDAISIRLPSGITTYDSTIAWGDRSITIRGLGPQSIIQADGASRLVSESADGFDGCLKIKDCTIDANHVPTSGQVININGAKQRLHLDNIHVKNLNVVNQGGNNGFVRIQEPIEELIVENSHFDYTEQSLTNRVNSKYAVVYNTSSAPIDRVTVRNNHHIGHLFDRDAHGIDYINGYSLNVNQNAQVYGNTFYKWDQYATFITCYHEKASVQIINNKTSFTNSGDQFRAGASATIRGGSVQMIGNINTGSGFYDDTGDKIGGDRTCVVEGGVPHHVVVSNNIAFDTLTPYSSPACRYTEFSNNLAINCGNPNTGEASRSMIIHSQGDYDVGYVMIRDNSFINETTDRGVDNCIRLRQVVSDGGGWDAECIIDGNVFKGYEAAGPIDSEIGGLLIEGSNFDLGA